MTDDRNVQHIKYGPGKVRDQDGTQTALQIIFIYKWLIQRLAEEHAEGRQEKESRDGKPGQDFQHGH